jgi:hypothetical protein
MMTSTSDRDALRRRWRLLVPLMAIVWSLIVVETVLRVRDHNPGFYAGDPDRGWRLNPGFEGWYEEENHVWVRINSDGLRDREHALAASPGTLRVAVLGDSYIEAMNVPFEQSFAAQLESRLNKCGPAGRAVEVLNFGVGGYGTAQQLFTYRNEIVKYRPDVVLLAVYTSNDIVDNLRELNPEKRERPYFGLRDGRLELLPMLPVPDLTEDLPWYQRWRLALTDRSAAANLLWGGYSMLRNGISPASPASPAGPDPGPVNDDKSLYVLEPPRNDEMREAWAITEALFATLAGDVAAGGSEFWMTTLSIAEQVHPDVATRAALAAKLGVESLFYPDHRIRDFARARGIPIVSLAEPLAEYSARTGEFLNGGANAAYPFGLGHWNATAHRLAAGMVGDRLCAESRRFMAER